MGGSSVAIAQGDHASALRLAERVIQINPQFLYDEDPIAHVYVAMERWQDGVERYESIPPETFNRPNFELAICYAHTGQIARARQILVQLEALAQQRYVDHTHLAGIHAALGDKDKAFAALDQALKDRSARVYAARFYPWLTPLRDDPRFMELENKVANSKLPSETPVPEKSIAVLPFENLSDNKNDAFFADGIHEDILASLSKIADLRLTSSASVLQYRNPGGAGHDLRAIANTLGVRNLLEGSVRRMGDRLLVKVQLTDVLQDRLVWAERYDRSIADSITLQGELASEIARALRARLSPLEPFRHAQLGLLYAFMQRKQDALREGERAVELAPIEKDAIYGAQMLALLAAICAQTGEHDRALELIQRLLVTPAAVLPAFEASITVYELRLRWH